MQILSLILHSLSVLIMRVQKVLNSADSMFK